MVGPAIPARKAQNKVDGVRLARLFHALSDETRLRIVERLLLGEQCVCNLMEPLELGQSHLSFHMKTLKAAGLVTDRREGRWIHYALNPETLREVQEFVGSSRGKGRAAGRRALLRGGEEGLVGTALWFFSLLSIK